MVVCHVSANLLGAAGRYHVPRVPLPLRGAGSRRLPRSGARLWGMKYKARSRTRQCRTQRRERHTLRRAIERRSTLRRYPKAAPAEGAAHGIGMASADSACKMLQNTMSAFPFFGSLKTVLSFWQDKRKELVSERTFWHDKRKELVSERPLSSQNKNHSGRTL